MLSSALASLFLGLSILPLSRVPDQRIIVTKPRATNRLRRPVARRPWIEDRGTWNMECGRWSVTGDPWVAMTVTRTEPAYRSTKPGQCQPSAQISQGGHWHWIAYEHVRRPPSAPNPHHHQLPVGVTSHGFLATNRIRRQGDRCGARFSLGLFGSPVSQVPCTCAFKDPGSH